MQIKIATNCFESKEKAFEYYRLFDVSMQGVSDKISKGEINIGPPEPPNELTIELKDGRFFLLKKT